MSFISTKLSLSFEINKHHEGKIHIEQFLARTASRETKTHHHHDGGPGRGKLTLRLLGKSIAHCKYLDFTFLPFTFLPFEGGRRTWKRETHLDTESSWKSTGEETSLQIVGQ